MTILEWMRETVETVDALKGKCFSPGLLVTEQEPPVAILSAQSETETTDLAGNVHHAATEFDLDIFAQTCDETWALYQAIAAVLRQRIDEAADESLWIFGAELRCKTPDAADLELELRRRTMTVTVRWCGL